MTKTKLISLAIHGFLSFVITVGTGILSHVGQSEISSTAIMIIVAGAAISIAKDVQSRLSPPPK